MSHEWGEDMKTRYVKIMRENTRCPYCGGLTVPPDVRYGIGAANHSLDCKTCGGIYYVHASVPGYSGAILSYAAVGGCVYIWYETVKSRWSEGALGTVGLTVELLLLLAVMLVLFTAFLDPSNYIYYCTKPNDEIRFGTYSEYEAELKISPEERKYIVNNMIYPICFTDEDGKPTSADIGVKLSEIRRSEGQYRCYITTLPKGEQIAENMLDKGFELFFDGKPIGSGRIVRNSDKPE
ncbi:MAG: hypothetical protein ACI4J5_08020 [Oscillospiraceae bacterium]